MRTPVGGQAEGVTFYKHIFVTDQFRLIRESVESINTCLFFASFLIRHEGYQPRLATKLLQ